MPISESQYCINLDIWSEIRRTDAVASGHELAIPLDA